MIDSYSIKLDDENQTYIIEIIYKSVKISDVYALGDKTILTYQNYKEFEHKRKYLHDELMKNLIPPMRPF